MALWADFLDSDYLNDWNNASLADVRTAEILIATALLIDPNSWLAYYARGFTNSVRGNHQAAFDDFKYVTTTPNPFHGRAYAQMANESLFLGNASLAVEHGLQATKLSPKDQSIGVFYWVTGRAYFALVDYANAVKYLYESVQKRPNLWFSRAWLIAAYAKDGQMTEAQKAKDAFVKQFPTYTLQKIRDTYTNGARYKNKPIQAASTQLFDGLQKAGLP